MTDERPQDRPLAGTPGYSAKLLKPDYWFFTPPKRGWRRVVVRFWAFGAITFMVVSWALALR